MYKLVQNEFYKFFAGKKIYMFMVITVIMALVMGFGVLIVQKSGQNVPELDQITGNSFPLSFLDMLANFFFPLFVIVMIADSITVELTEGTLKLTLLHPVTRRQLLNAKMITILILLVLYVVYSLIIGYIIGIPFFGWTESFDYKGYVLTAGDGLLTTIGSYLVLILPTFGFGLLTFLLALQITSTSSAIISALGLLFFLRITAAAITPIARFLVTSYFEMYNFLLPTVNWAHMVYGFVVIGITGLIGYLATWYIFERKDLQN